MTSNNSLPNCNQFPANQLESRHSTFCIREAMEFGGQIMGTNETV